MNTNHKVLLLYLVVIAGGFVYAAATNDTTMTWVVASNASHTLAYAGACSSSSFYFVESTCTFDSDADGNGSKCLPQTTSAGGTACQDASTYAVTITNNGNVAANIDGNFTDAFSGVDTNIVLKIWMGNETGCGANGLGGWAQDCTVTTSTNPVTATTCRNFNEFTETAAGRLTTSLGVNDTNGLCFSGDFNGTVSQGEHAVTFRTTSISS
ncbi:MAG: hypothetical protein NUV67_04780 [archaeon]|nr:hypothetical protein [archaeon]